MSSNRDAFFARVRAAPFGGHLTQSQVDGIDAILAAAPDEMGIEPLAYCFATAFHETAKTMQPIEEYGKGKGRTYGKPDQQTGKVYYGRGLVQLTWKVNYDKAGRALMADLVNHPELALQPSLAASIMFRGMSEGWFTGKKLSDYFSPDKSDPVGARRIINGTDKADLIAGYHAAFLAALKTGQVEAAPAAAVLPPKPAPAKAPPITAPPVIVAGQGSIFSRLAASFREIFNEGH